MHVTDGASPRWARPRPLCGRIINGQWHGSLIVSMAAKHPPSNPASAPEELPPPFSFLPRVQGPKVNSKKGKKGLQGPNVHDTGHARGVWGRQCWS